METVLLVVEISACLVIWQKLWTDLMIQSSIAYDLKTAMNASILTLEHHLPDRDNSRDLREVGLEHSITE